MAKNHRKFTEIVVKSGAGELLVIHADERAFKMRKMPDAEFFCHSCGSDFDWDHACGCGSTTMENVEIKSDYLDGGTFLGANYAIISAKTGRVGSPKELKYAH